MIESMKMAGGFILLTAFVHFLFFRSCDESRIHNSEGPCVESVNSVAWYDDGRCYDTRSTLELLPGGNKYICRCPKAGTR